jgi:ABC-type Fe3+/spermidine/putrescine transport system ATPase subunit
VVRLQEVTKRYGSGPVVENLSLDIVEGEILTLLGPSGCGKTTTLRMVLGLERCTSGRIFHKGRLVDHPADGIFTPAHKRNMGMVFQSYAIWPHMTVAQNIAYGLRVRRENKRTIRDKVSRIIGLVGLDGLEQRAATQLSGGQQQRVALARSLVFEPDLLLLDEPFSNLDAKLREQMRGEIKILQRRLGMTVLFVTHDQAEALSLSDRIAVMHNGEIEQIGRPEELYRNPATPLVRDFLGSLIVIAAKVVEKENAGFAFSPQGDPSRRIHARPTSRDLAVGQSCLLTLRPEFAVVRAAPAGPPSSAGNLLDGVIETMLFLGDRYEANIQLPWSQNISVTVPAEQAWEEGAAVQIQIPEDKVQVWS